jgi:1,2-diacylglycerol 3-alpha-glucosyltransferase
MRIGMVTAVYKPVVNGVTRMISLYKTHLERMGHEVTIFTLGDPDPQGDENGVIRSPAIPVGDQGYQFGVRYSREAKARMRSMDILHCHHLLFGVDFAHRYGKCPIVVTNHTRHDLYTSAYLPLPQQAADVLMRQLWPEYTSMADVVIAPSDSVREILLHFGVRQPIEVIPNGVELEQFFEPGKPLAKSDLGIPESAVLAIYTGRLSEEKNLAALLDQFAIALDIVPDLHLMLVGDGSFKAELQQRAVRLNIADSVHFYGAVKYEALPLLLAAADIYVTASVSEVHPLTVIEAMAIGLPVAASRSPGISDTVEHGVTGFLTSDPAQGLAAAMLPLVTNPELRVRMGHSARLASQAYDIRRTVVDTLRLYESLRAARPDLQREAGHGRGYRPYTRLGPRLKELVNRMRYEDDKDEAANGKTHER